jgi:hypothetical protein
MPSPDPASLRFVFDRSGGVCHLCHGLYGPIRFELYGCTHHPEGWERDHDIPRSVGGPDDVRNYLAAHAACNRSKGATPTRIVRERNGVVGTPPSTQDLREMRFLAEHDARGGRPACWSSAP